jgi:coatomer protein complex subunit gamma
MYVTSEGKDTFATPFDLSKIPVVSREQADADDRAKYLPLHEYIRFVLTAPRKIKSATPTVKPPTTKASAKSGEEAAAVAAQKYAEELQKIPELAAYGSVLKSSSPVALTESETEYVVQVIKHVFKDDNVVLQFVCCISFCFQSLG